jgi:guanylate kinase|tara:strand:+ start:743 stop:1372 length:630 start_codon:yes stop_codon:yes gene_type:complete
LNKQDHTTGQLYVISAPSGAGKTSLVKALLESTSNLQVSVSHTTRAIRPGESDGVNYHFVDESEFTSIRDAHGFFEWAQVFGNFYGTSRHAIQERLAEGIDIVLEIDWQGARQVKMLVDDAVSIFVLPPSTAALRKRLTDRGQDDDEIIEGRMQAARDELAHYDEADFIVLNDDFEIALQDLQSIIRAQRLSQQVQSRELTSVIADLLR